MFAGTRPRSLISNPLDRAHSRTLDVLPPLDRGAVARPRVRTTPRAESLRPAPTYEARASRKLRRVRRAEVNLVRGAVDCELDSLVGLAAVEVVLHNDNLALRHGSPFLANSTTPLA